ncbi:MAG: glycosyl hydrolase-related protein [bacterium]|nr:glycosyl hydrolase-related protein [bacterium]
MLDQEWRHRIERWREALLKLMYRPLGMVVLEGSGTFEQLSVRQAEKLKFRPMPPGSKWGRKWEYMWFRGKVKLPEEARGERIVVRINVGAESAVLVNGEEAGAVDHEHREITLAKKGVPGSVYELLVEAYGGHGVLEVGYGPVPDGVETVPEPPPTQCVVGETTFGIWDEEVYQTYLDFETLLQVRDNTDQNSLRVAEIDAGLKEFTLLVDVELPRPQLRTALRVGRARLRPLLECVNGSTVPRMYCFGHSHIDVAWLWPLQETERKCRRTFATQLALMKEYPEYRFLQSQAHLYWMVKRRYPELYRRIKAAVRAGQWIPEGGMWVEPDTNIAGGEALIRQLMHGKRFFKEEFGVESELMWLPDVFGYSGALPQIMRGCGIKYFSTQKIFWTYHGGEMFPYHTFWWEGIDGTRVLAHIHNDYNSRSRPVDVIQRWNERVQKDGIVSRLFPFGHGDGGGGPTRDHLEFLRRMKNLEGVPECIIASPVRFFKDEEERRARLPVYVGELYFQAHRGTYTSQAKVKKGNRQCEYALREAEMWSVVAAVRAGRVAPVEKLDRLWKLVLLNQFHDILPGSSIARVYEDAARDHVEVIREAGAITTAAQRALIKPSRRALTIFNSLSWERAALVPLPLRFRGAVDRHGKPLAVQKIGGILHALVPHVPGCGWVTVTDGPPGAAVAVLRAAPDWLENEHLRLRVNEFGELVSIYDKDAQMELAAGLCNRFRMYKDVPSCFDAWDIDSMYKLTPVEITSPAEIEVVEKGPLVASVRVRKRVHQSEVTQEIVLRAGSRCVEFRTVIEWRERHKLLKVNFPVTVHSHEALHEIQFGHVRRPTHASRQFDADRFEVAQQKWTALAEEGRGVAILNDCKYGVSVEGSSINLTLLRASLAPDMRADLGRHEFTYALYAWNGSLTQSRLLREAYELNVPVRCVEGDGGHCAWLHVDAANVIVETIKPAEDGSGDVVVRLYEAMRTATMCTLEVATRVARVAETDMLEREQRRIGSRGGRIRVSFRPFEIKTLRFVLE